MELRQLSYFATIVNEGNISQAAKKLNISQPPLSHQMKLLESELGVTLFERGSRRIRLTPAGKTFYDRALAILDLSQAARTELTAQKQEIQGVVRLGIISSAVEFVTRHYLAPFRRSYPKALFELHESNSYHLLDLLHSNQIDLAVIRTPFAKAGLEMQTLPPEAFLGAFLTTLLIMAIAGRAVASKATVIWAGIAEQALLNAGISFLSLLDADVLVSYSYFSAGGLSNTDIRLLWLPGAIILLGFSVSLACSGKIRLLCLGDDLARSLGVRVGRVRMLCLICASASAAPVSANAQTPSFKKKFFISL